MTLAGSKGGTYWSIDDPQGFDIPIVKYWREVGEKTLTGAEVYQKLVDSARPTQVEFGIGNTCGLQCKHCFLGYDSGVMNDSLIPLPRLIEGVTELIEDFETRMICITDRDALTPNRSIPLFEHLNNLRKKHQDLKFGGVTNGLAIDKYLDDLSRIKLDYLDISIDGLKHEHDAIRGEGMFDKTLANLRLGLKHQIAERLIVATTLTRFNNQSIIKMIRQLIIEEGVQWFDVGPLMAVKMQPYQLREADVANFLNDLTQSLKSVEVSQPVNIFMEICAYCAAFIPALVDQGWLIPEEIRQDRYGHLYQEIPINDRITITLRTEFIPEYWRHTLRITADGYVIGGCEALTQADYERFSVGNFKNESVKDLYQKSLAIGSPFHKMMLAYDNTPCRDKPCFLHCLGGDSLLAKSVYNDYNRKDPNCVWDEYDYQNKSKSQEITYVS